MSDKHLMHVFIFALLPLLILYGCQGNRIYKVKEEKILSINMKIKSLAEIRNDIVSAGTPLGWVFAEKAPGHLVGTLAVRMQMAIVDVKYNKKVYSIAYKDSENLDYNGKSIHPNYNDWVKDLSRNINLKFNGS